MSVLVLCGQALLADEPVSRGEAGSIREVFVPADEPAAWPPGKWLARPMDEYRQMRADLAAEEAAPPRAVLSRVTYSATFSGDALTDGRLTADVGLRGAEAAWLSLGEPTLAIRRLEWPDRSAVWGLSPTGETLLRVPKDRSRLKGNWSVRGYELFGRVEFDATLLPAVISLMELRLPVSQRLVVNDPVTVQTFADPDPEYRKWLLDLGQRPRVRFAVTEQPADIESQPSLVERVSRYSLKPDGLELNADFLIESLNETTDRLAFAVSPGMVVSSVRLGTEVELPFRHLQDGPESRVIVPLERRSLAGRVNVRVQCIRPIPAAGSGTLPRVSLEQFPFIKSQLHVTVHRPLELRDYSATDCRLITSTSNRHQTDHLEFEDWSAESQLSVRWDMPPAEVDADVLCVVDGTQTQPSSRTLLKLTARSGSTFEIICPVPRGWQVSRVTSQPWQQTPVLASWQSTPDDAGTTRLRLEFRDALTAGRGPVLLEIRAGWTDGPWPTEMTLPVIAPSGNGLHNIRLALLPPEEHKITLPLDSSYRSATLAEIQEAWGDVIGSWDNWLAESLWGIPPSEEMLYFAASFPAAAEAMRISPQQPAGQSSEQQRKVAAASSAGGDTVPADERLLMQQPPSASAARLAQVTLETEVPAVSGQDCVQVVSYRLHHPASGTELTFELAAPGMLIAARVDGQEKHAAIAGQTVRVRLPAGTNSRLIEIEYRVPFFQSFLRGSGEILLPQSELQVSGLHWRVKLPPSFRIGPTTSGASFEQQPVGWRQRWLGPLGVAPVASAFWPFGDWSEPDVRSVATSQSDEASSEPASNDTDQPDAPFRVQSRTVPFSARTLRLEIWKEDQARHLGWVLLVAALLITLFAGRGSAPRITSIRWAAAAGSGLAAILVPDSLAIPCGGLFVGTLAGSLLSPPLNRGLEWLNREHVSDGSTRMLAGAAAMLLLIAIGSSGKLLAVQLEFPETPGAIDQREAATEIRTSPIYEAMIPVRSGRPTLDETPVVYVSPALLPRWEAAKLAQLEQPPYLIRGASYLVTRNLLSMPRVKAVFDVLLLGSASRRIAFPLRNIAIDDDQPCLVNGRHATMIPLQADAGIAVDIPPQIVPATSEGEPASSGDSLPATELRIELTFRPRARDVRTSPIVRFGIPPLLSSLAEIQYRALADEQLVVNGLGAMIRDSGSEMLRAELGPVPQLEVEDHNSSQQPGTAAMVPDLALSSLEIDPLQLRIRTRLRFRTPSNTDEQAISTVEVRLPPGTHVNDVRAPGLIGSQSIGLPGQPVQVQMAFAGLTTDLLEVEIDSVLPAAHSGQTVRIPRIPLLEESETDGFRKHLLAVTARPGFRVDANSALLLGAHLSPITPTSFNQTWGGRESVDPDLAFELAVPQTIDLSVLPLLPTCEATVREALSREGSRFRWEADIDLECRSAPVALHRFLIDPRIRVTSARVDQKGADRLMRWSRGAGAELTLLLTEDLLGSQTVHLAGELPAELDQAVDLPQLEMPEAEVRQHEFVIRNSTGWTVDVLGADQTVLRAEPAASSAGQKPQADGDRVFDRLSPIPPEMLRVTEDASTFDYERIVSLHADGKNRLRMTTLIRIAEDVPLPPHIEFVVPPEWVRFGPLKTSPALTADGTGQGRSTVYILETGGRQQRATSESPSQVDGLVTAGVRSVEFSVTFPMPGENAWRVRNIQLTHGSLTRQRLVLSGAVPYAVVGEAREIPLDDNLRSDLGNQDDAGNLPPRAFESAPAPWRLLPRHLVSAGGHVRRMESAIWEVPQYGYVGTTSAQILLQQPQQVQVELPSGLELVSAAWNDTPLSFDPQAPRSLTVPLSHTNPPLHPHRLEMWWRLPRASHGLRLQVPLPGIQHLPVMRETAVFLGSQNSLYESSGAWTRLTDWNTGPASSPTGRNRSPIHEALAAAGYASGAVESSSSILVEQIAEPQIHTGPSVITLWALSRFQQRMIVAALLVLLFLLAAWQVKRHAALRSMMLHPSTQVFGGPTLLAGMLWTMGPSAVGFALLLTCGVAWTVTTWRDRLAESSFELSTDRSG